MKKIGFGFTRIGSRPCDHTKRISYPVGFRFNLLLAGFADQWEQHFDSGFPRRLGLHREPVGL